jgi:hypothetical protein
MIILESLSFEYYAKKLSIFAIKASGGLDDSLLNMNNIGQISFNVSEELDGVKSEYRLGCACFWKL